MNDRDFLLSVLSDGEPHTHAEILQASFEARGCGMTVHSRAADLRQLGYDVDCSLATKNGRVASTYRLLASPGAGEPQTASPAGPLPASVGGLGSPNEPSPAPSEPEQLSFGPDTNQKPVWA